MGESRAVLHMACCTGPFGAAAVGGPGAGMHSHTAVRPHRAGGERRQAWERKR